MRKLADLLVGQELIHSRRIPKVAMRQITRSCAAGARLVELQGNLLRRRACLRAHVITLARQGLPRQV